MTREERIREIFKYTDLKQAGFASKIGVSQQMVSDVFNDKKKAGDKIIMGIIDNFAEISPLWLLKGKGEMLVKEKPESHPDLSALQKECTDLQQKVDKLTEELSHNNKLIKYLENDLEQYKDKERLEALKSKSLT